MLPKEYQPSRAVLIICVIFLSALFIYGLMNFIERRSAFSSGARYTVAHTTEMYVTTSGRSIRYCYKVDGIEHTGNSPYAYNSKVPNGRYWVKFSVAKPSISTIYQDRPVSLTMKEVPPNGFRSIPR